MFSIARARIVPNIHQHPCAPVPMRPYAFNSVCRMCSTSTSLTGRRHVHYRTRPYGAQHTPTPLCPCAPVPMQDVLNFDFLDAPPRAAILRSLELLYALGALDSKVGVCTYLLKVF
jgi:HrpA-like RNA helicase